MQRKSGRQFVVAVVVAVVAGVPIFLLGKMQMLTELWLPCALALFLAVLPLLAQWVVPSMLKGLFDLDLSPRLKLPVRVFFATLAAYSVAATAYVTGRLMLLTGPERYGIPPPRLWQWIEACLHPAGNVAAAIGVIAALSGLSLYVAAYAIAVSYHQDPGRSLMRMLAGALCAVVVADVGAWFFIRCGSAATWLALQIRDWELIHWLGRGYTWPYLVYHLQAGFAATLALLLYAGLGIYGRRALGRTPTVAALIGPLMAAKIFGWAGSALIFFLGRWHTPVLLVAVVAAVLIKYFHGADHTYEMVDRSKVSAPSPYTVFSAKEGRRCAIVVAAAGGGIQAAAWTAQVVKGLHDENGAAFDNALCALSGISGGSMGSACYVHWLANPNVARDPIEAASDSSLDEVAWGLAWPDLIRIFLPWVVGRSIDRAEAMEHAWVGNASMNANPDQSPLWDALSGWNERVAKGELPALFMGSTMVESGFPLLLETSEVKNRLTRRASDSWMEGSELHWQGKRPMDIPVVRGARLSASFPYVTPVARPRLANQQPHMIDGGLFDNYGMATLTEWLDQALEEQHSQGKTATGVNRILLIQTNGFPKDKGTLPTPDNSHEGWPFQLIAPVEVLANVRTAGQTSHRDIEFGMLKQKWAGRGVQISDAVFEFNQEDAPLSWHLMPLQKAAIPKAWNGDFDTEESSVIRERKKVREFLSKCTAADAPPAAG